MIEFAAADPVADRLAVTRFDRRLAHGTGEKAGDRLQHSTARIFDWIDVERVEHLWRDPSAAHFIPREGLPVQNADLQSCIAQLPGTRRTCWAAAGDQDIEGVHIGCSWRACWVS
jgi:hypothetical protein